MLEFRAEAETHHQVIRTYAFNSFELTHALPAAGKYAPPPELLSNRGQDFLRACLTRDTELPLSNHLYDFVSLDILSGTF